MAVKIDINIPEAEGKRSPLFKRAQMWLDNEVLKDCNPYVPMRTGVLAGSGIRGTKIGSGKVVYNAPYARRRYYDGQANISTAKHPQACAMWFEKSKAVNCQKWESGVNQITRGMIQ